MFWKDKKYWEWVLGCLVFDLIGLGIVEYLQSIILLIFKQLDIFTFYAYFICLPVLIFGGSYLMWRK